MSRTFLCALAFALALVPAVGAGKRPEALGLTAAPARIVFHGGGAARVRLRNPGRKTVAVEVASAGLALDLRGRPRIVKRGGPSSAAGWLRLRPARIRLAPHAAGTLLVSARVPRAGGARRPRRARPPERTSTRPGARLRSAAARRRRGRARAGRGGQAVEAAPAALGAARRQASTRAGRGQFRERDRAASPRPRDPLEAAVKPSHRRRPSKRSGAPCPHPRSPRVSPAHEREWPGHGPRRRPGRAGPARDPPHVPPSDLKPRRNAGGFGLVTGATGLEPLSDHRGQGTANAGAELVQFRNPSTGRRRPGPRVTRPGRRRSATE